MKTPPYKFMVRLPSDMRERIAEAAAMYRRSMNSEIVARLEQSFSGLPEEVAERGVEPPLHHQLEAMFRRSLSDDEQCMLRGFRRLGLAKQKALLDLLK